MWAAMIHPVSHGGWFQQKPGGQEEQIQIQKEAYSGEGEALLFHDGMGGSAVVILLPAYFTLLSFKGWLLLLSDYAGSNSSVRISSRERNFTVLSPSEPLPHEQAVGWLRKEVS